MNDAVNVRSVHNRHAGRRLVGLRDDQRGTQAERQCHGESSEESRQGRDARNRLSVPPRAAYHDGRTRQPDPRVPGLEFLVRNLSGWMVGSFQIGVRAGI